MHDEIKYHSFETQSCNGKGPFGYSLILEKSLNHGKRVWVSVINITQLLEIDVLKVSASGGVATTVVDSFKIPTLH